MNTFIMILSLGIMILVVLSLLIASAHHKIHAARERSGLHAAQSVIYRLAAAALLSLVVLGTLKTVGWLPVKNQGLTVVSIVVVSVAVSYGIVRLIARRFPYLDGGSLQIW